MSDFQEEDVVYILEYEAYGEIIEIYNGKAEILFEDEEEVRICDLNKLRY